MTPEEIDRARSRAAEALYDAGRLRRRRDPRRAAEPEQVSSPPPQPPQPPPVSTPAVSRRRVPPRPKPAPKPAPKPKPPPKLTCDKGHPRDYQPPSKRWPMCLICHREHARLSKARKRERELQAPN